MMRFSPSAKPIALSLLTLTLMVSSAAAVAPTREAVEKWKAEGVWEQIVANWKAFKKAGGCAPEVYTPFDKEKHRQSLALGVKTVDTAYVIVILVDFSDWPYYGQAVAGTPADFDSILFSNRDTDPIINPTGSMTDFYLENSYGQFYIKGDIFGWYRMDSTYAWYVGGDDGLSRGSILAGHAVDAAAADPNVDFSHYDNLPPYGYCDGVVIIHPGRGAEEGAYGIWSHKSNISPAKNIDGVWVSAYTMNPEEASYPVGVKLSPIGVFCHEYGHMLGLPDLYDIDYNPGSDGLGEWSLMAYGNQLNYSRTPAHLDAWCKDSAGFLNLIEVDANVYQAAIPAVEHNPVAYKLQNVLSGHQYWVVENRRKTGFDLYLPGQGLCIYHVDTKAPQNNIDPNRYYVAMEQADGRNDLAFTDGNEGDAGDPWPGLAREFHDLSIPNSHTNEIVAPPAPDSTTEIGVWRISNADSLMTADFDIEYSRPWVELYGDNALVFVDDDLPGDDGYGILEPGETVQFYCTVINKMRYSYNVHATLATDNPAVSFITNNVAFGVHLFDTAVSNVYAPIEFTLADTLTPIIDSFFLMITTDSLINTPGSGEFADTFGFEVQIGAPQVLIVDDDRGDNFETMYEDAFLRLKVPTKTWHKQTQGSPAGTDLGRFSMVFWHTGEAASDVLDSNDIAAMKYFMDIGGNLLLSTLSGTYDLASLDSTILPQYFHAEPTTGSFEWRSYKGVAGNKFSEETLFRYSAAYVRPSVPLLTPVNGGEKAFTLEKVDEDSVCGVSYASTHKSILLTFPVECLLDNAPPYDPKDTLIARAFAFFGGTITSVYDGRPFVQIPRNFELYQNYPNPFNPATNISYTLRGTGGSGKKPVRTNLSVYNILGQRVSTLVDEVQIPGTYVVTWNGDDRFGQQVASGVYFYRLELGDDSETKKMVLLR